MPTSLADKFPRRPARDRNRAVGIVATLRDALADQPLPSVSEIAETGRDPFEVLISTIISLRTKDEVTFPASARLFRLANTPDKMATLSAAKIAKAIYPAGFYKTKADTIREISKQLRDHHGGRVPDSVDELVAFKGVGRKTATLVVSLGYGVPAVCVDTHVHRISNRLGLIATRNPDESEFALMALLPEDEWIGYNELMVTFGQQICVPISPHCSKCPVRRRCPQLGVDKTR